MNEKEKEEIKGMVEEEVIKAIVSKGVEEVLEGKGNLYIELKISKYQEKKI